LAEVLVGCCGFPVSRRRYMQEFRVVEVQKTFYKPPSKETLERWRREAPSGFEFTVKAWQAVTHPPTSPTWRKAGIKPKGNPENYGYLKPTPENLEAWRVTLEAARILEARVVVLQTPASFKCTEENAENAIRFFRMIERDNLLVAWEPRGCWHTSRELLRRVLEEGEVIHVTDILRRRPVIVKKVAYTRLHGLGGREVNYRYRYTEEDLRRLLSEVRWLEEQGAERIYVMFNNIYMYSDAKRFMELLAARG